MQKFLKGVLWTAIVVGAICGVLRLVLFKTWTLPDDLQLAASVEPTLHYKDTVLLLTRGKRAFGELVRCKDPDDPSRYAVGRIVGFEGDVIELKGRQVYINGKRYDQVQACPPAKYFFIHPHTEAEVPMECGVVEMGGGWYYRGHEKKMAPSTSFKAVVGEGMVFLLSDNIDFHDDSRDYGVLERSSCTEKIVFRFWGEAGMKDEERRMTYIH
ncbi:MAG TPA: signal peptidase I [Polyangium sp.]|nr:signal peptidase I [Polyangium sp.]